MNQYVLFGWDFDFLAENPLRRFWPVEFPIEFPVQVTQIQRTFYSDNVIVGIPNNGELVQFSLDWFIYEKLENETTDH